MSKNYLQCEYCHWKASKRKRRGMFDGGSSDRLRKHMATYHPEKYIESAQRREIILEIISMEQ